MSLIKDHKKPRRDRIAREAEEAEARVTASIERGKANAAYNKHALDMITEGTRLFFAHRGLKESWNYPHTGSLQDILDIVRLEFYRYQKELGIGGQKEGCTNIPDDPEFGMRGRHAMSREEWNALEAFREGRGPRPWFVMDDGDLPPRKP